MATGIFQAMHYKLHVNLAFLSVEHIMRDVEGGWLSRYAHANGASMFSLLYTYTYSVVFITAATPVHESWPGVWV